MENLQNDWKLKSLSIHQSWQKDAPYAGTINFTNGIKMEFALNLNSEKCAKLISILKDEVVESAKELSDLMVNSMPIALKQPEEIKQIESTDL